MKQPRLIGIALGLLLPAALTAHATTFRDLDLNEMLDAAEVAIHGTVRTADALLQDGEPWTIVVFDVQDLFLDAESPKVTDGQLTLAFLGGNAGGEQLTVSLMPQFAPGDEVLLLAYTEPFMSPIVGFNQGLWRLDPQGNWVDETAVVLGVDEDGELSEGGTETDAELVIDALRSVLEVE